MTKRVVVVMCWACGERVAGNELAGEYSAYCLECQPWPGRAADGPLTGRGAKMVPGDRAGG